MIEHERSVGGNTGCQVFSFFLSALPLPKCFTTEQGTIEASLLFYDKESNNFPMHLAQFSKLYFPNEEKWHQPFSVL